MASAAGSTARPGERITIPGYLGILEDAEPEMGMMYGEPVGVMDSCVNFAPTGSGPLKDSIYAAPKISRMAVRGGSQNQLTLTDGAPGNNMTSVLAIRRWSQAGAAIVAHTTVTSKHWAFQTPADLSSVVQKTDIGWNTAVPARPRIVEMFEKLYIADATQNISSRQQLVSLTSAPVLTPVTADLGAGLEAFKPYCIEVYNNVLFASGQQSGGVQEPSILWHSFLGTTPDANVASGSPGQGWNNLAFNFIGAKGEAIRAMCSGDNGMLIAKENQLYLLSGFGQAVEGWQYTVTALDNTESLGCLWPGALTYAEGNWYGIGSSGPFVTDGQTTQVLVNARRRSWLNVGALDKAIVRFNPDRRCIEFGVLNSGDTAITTIWLWHIDRHYWVGDWKLPQGVIDFTSLPSGAFQGPTAPPISITITDASATLTSITGVVTLGDVTSATEISVDAGAGFYVDQVIGPAVTAFTTTVALPSSLQVQVRARAVKNGIYSAYCTQVPAHTLLAVPSGIQTGLEHFDFVVMNVTQNANNRTLYVKNGGVTFKTYTHLATGTYALTDNAGGLGLPCGSVFSYSAVAEDLTWPAAIQQSTPGTWAGNTDCSAPH